MSLINDSPLVRIVIEHLIFVAVASYGMFPVFRQSFVKATLHSGVSNTKADDTLWSQAIEPVSFSTLTGTCSSYATHAN
jgi:hypothetical protein